MHKKIRIAVWVVFLLLAGAFLASMADFDMDFTLGDGTARDVCTTYDLDVDQQFCWIETEDGFRPSYRLIFDSRLASWPADDFYMRVMNFRVFGGMGFGLKFDNVTQQSTVYAAGFTKLQFSQGWELRQGQFQKRVIWGDTTGFSFSLAENMQALVDGQFNALGNGFGTGGIIQKGIEVRTDGTTQPYFFEAQRSLGGGDRQFRIAPRPDFGSAELQWFPTGGSFPSYSLYKDSGDNILAFHSGNSETSEFYVGLQGYGLFIPSFHKDVTASATQTQAGGTKLNKQYSLILTAVTNGDAVTIDFTKVLAVKFMICNGDSAQSIQVFPKSGTAFFGTGTDNPLTLLTGECLHGIDGHLPSAQWHWWIT